MLYKQKQTHSDEQNKHKNHCQPNAAWSYHMEGHAEKCVDKYCGRVGRISIKSQRKRRSIASKLTETPSMDDHQFSPEDFNSTRELAPTYAQFINEMSVPDQMWKTFSTLDGQYAGTISHQVEQSLRQDTHTTEKLHQSH